MTRVLIRLAWLALATCALCAGQSQGCPQDQPTGVNRPVFQPDKVCRYERPGTVAQSGYWWQLLFEQFRWKPANRPPFRRSVAFLAGVSEYSHITPSLDFVKTDLRELRNFLLTEGGFDAVYEVRDGNVTRDVLDDYMRRQFTDAGKLLTSEDRLLIYYSGHGAAQYSQVPYLQFKEAVPGDYSKHVLPARDVYDWAKAIVAKHLLVIFDSCASGLTGDAKDGDDVGDLSNALAGEQSGILLTAGTGEEKAYALKYSEQKKASVFTQALLDALPERKNRQG